MTQLCHPNKACAILRRWFRERSSAGREVCFYYYIEKAPAYIKEVFSGEQAACNHDRVDKDGGCRFRKTYTIDGRFIEKCSGITFEFHHPDLHKLKDYIDLFTEFYPQRKSGLKSVAKIEIGG